MYSTLLYIFLVVTQERRQKYKRVWTKFKKSCKVKNTFSEAEAAINNSIVKVLSTTLTIASNQ